MSALTITEFTLTYLESTTSPFFAFFSSSPEEEDDEEEEEEEEASKAIWLRTVPAVVPGWNARSAGVESSHVTTSKPLEVKSTVADWSAPLLPLRLVESA